MARAVLVLTVVLYARALEITLNLGEDDPEARLSFSATDDLPARAMEFASERGLVAGAARVVEDAMRRARPSDALVLARGPRLRAALVRL